VQHNVKVLIFFFFWRHRQIATSPSLAIWVAMWGCGDLVVTWCVKIMFSRRSGVGLLAICPDDDGALLPLSLSLSGDLGDALAVLARPSKAC
jgi:hypothetical protein